MLYITGDTHGDILRFTGEGSFCRGNLKKDDIIIVCGDFGFIFYPEGTAGAERQKNELETLSKQPYTILWVDGNHENFDLLGRFPTEERYGGTVHKIRHNIFHLMRGHVYDIEGKTVFTMGGAYSIDRCARTLGRSYWEEELPSNSEYREATKNLRESGNKVDIIVTHTAPRRIIRSMGCYPDDHDMELTGFFDWLTDEISFEKWFFGHWHTDKQINNRFRALWFDVVEV